MNLDQILNELREELRLIDERIALLSALAGERSPSPAAGETGAVIDFRMRRPARLRRDRRIGEGGTPAKTI